MAAMSWTMSRPWSLGPGSAARAARPAARPARAHPAAALPAVALDDLTRRSPAAAADVPRLVGPAVSARDDVLAPRAAGARLVRPYDGRGAARLPPRPATSAPRTSSSCSSTGWSTTRRGPPHRRGRAARPRSPRRCRRAGSTSLVVPGGLASWRAARRPSSSTRRLTAAELDRTDGVLTGARGRDRRDRHDRARRLARPGPPGAHPGARLPPVRRTRRPGRRRRSPRRSPASTRHAAADLDQRPVGDQRHRAATASRASTAPAPSRSSSSTVDGAAPPCGSAVDLRLDDVLARGAGDERGHRQVGDLRGRAGA